ncbi:hypothetical protein H8959_012556 [Pygathrix nigripes]
MTKWKTRDRPSDQMQLTSARLKEIIRFRFQENPIRSFSLALSRSRYSRRGDTVQPTLGRRGSTRSQEGGPYCPHRPVGRRKEARPGFSEANDNTEEAGASLPLTLRSEKPHLKGRAGPGFRKQWDQSRDARRCPGKAALGASGSPRGGLRTSSWAGPRAGPGLVVEPLVIHHGGRGGRCLFLSSAGAGAGSRVLRLRSPSAVHGPTGGGRLSPSAELGGCDCLRAVVVSASGAGGEGVSGRDPLGLGQLRRPGLLYTAPAFRCLGRQSLSSLTAPSRLWDTGGGLFPPAWDTPFSEAWKSVALE